MKTLRTPWTEVLWALWVKATLRRDAFHRQLNSLDQNRPAYVAFSRESILAAFHRELLLVHMRAMGNHECLSTNWPITSWIPFFHVIFQIPFQSKKKKVSCFHDTQDYICGVFKHKRVSFHKIWMYSSFSHRLVRHSKSSYPRFSSSRKCGAL